MIKSRIYPFAVMCIQPVLFQADMTFALSFVAWAWLRVNRGRWVKQGMLTGVPETF